MYPDKNGQIEFKDLSNWYRFSKKLNSENRWIKIANEIPWREIEKKYEKQFSKESNNTAHPARMAFGTLLIQRMLDLTDRKTVEAIEENPYLQFFIGLEEFEYELPFSHTMLSKWRKKMNMDMIIEVSNTIAGWEKPGEKGMEKDKNEDEDEREDKNGDDKKRDEDSKENVGDNQGELILDATCIPADIRFPTDVSLLNEVREKQEQIIDKFHSESQRGKAKPRTYRQIAHKAYLAFAKTKRPGIKIIRKALRAQLGFVKRNFSTIEKMLKEEPWLIELLTEKQKREFSTMMKVFEQQEEMYKTRTNSVKDRIVSIHQPYVRPIIRGKARASTEFGAKLSIGLIGGYAHIDRLQFDPYNESGDLIPSVEAYRNRFGYYPAAVLVDQIYRTRENIRFCAENHIRLSGPKLGRKQKEQNKVEKAMARKDASHRVTIEGKFGEGKRFYGMDRNMGKTEHTSKVMIAFDILVLNISKRLRDFLRRFPGFHFFEISQLKPFFSVLERLRFGFQIAL